MNRLFIVIQATSLSCVYEGQFVQCFGRCSSAEAVPFQRAAPSVTPLEMIIERNEEFCLIKIIFHSICNISL